MDQLLCCRCVFFPPFLRVCLETETEIVSMHMCARLRMRVHICGVIVWQRYFRHMVGLYDSFTGKRGREGERVIEAEWEGEGGSLPSQPGSLSAYTIFQLNLRLSNVGYAARVSSIFHKRSAISCFGTHGALTDTHGEYTPYSLLLLVACAFGIVTYREITV